VNATTVCRTRCLSSRHGRSNGRRPDEAQCHCLEVLHNGGKVELVAGAAETAKTHTLEAMLDLKMCKAHLYFFARFTRSLELWRAP
jgi:hypothetical protein